MTKKSTIPHTVTVSEERNADPHPVTAVIADLLNSARAADAELAALMRLAS